MHINKGIIHLSNKGNVIFANKGILTQNPLSMKQFLKFFLASILGTTVTLLIFLLLLISLIAGMASFSSKPKVEVKEKTILRLTIDRDVIDRAPNNPFQNYNWQSMESEESYGLNELIENLRKAKEDPKISGILLEVPAGVSGLAIAEELEANSNPSNPQENSSFHTPTVILKEVTTWQA